MKWEQSRLLRWQILTISLMVLGYAGYYFCRSNLSVLLPQLSLELQARGMSASEAKINLGMISSIGVLGYALGKFFNGGVLDFLGGRKGFLIGMLGSVIFTLVFVSGGGIPVFTLAWVGNRLFQSMGWPGVVKITSRWFSYKSYGSAMGVISLSYLFGDAISRKVMSLFLSYGYSWRWISILLSFCLFGLFLLNYFLLKESPQEIGETEPKARENTLFGSLGQQARPPSLKALLIPLIQSRAFRWVCLLSFGSSLVRETFNNWTPTYFNESFGFTPVEAAAQSAWFPFFGGISVLVSGYVGDRVGRSGKAGVLSISLLLTCLALGVLSWVDKGVSREWAVYWTALIGFLMLGPYSYLGGAMALDFGGKQGSATVCGVLDGVGCLGGYFAGEFIAQISVLFGWRGAFLFLSLIALLSSAAAFLLYCEQEKTFSEKSEIELDPSQQILGSSVV